MNDKPVTVWPEKRPQKTILQAQAAATKLSRAKGKVQRMPTDYPPQWFTAPFGVATEGGEHGFPPHFDWDGRRGYVSPSAISMLQATLRRPMTREAA